MESRQIIRTPSTDFEDFEDSRGLPHGPTHVRKRDVSVTSNASTSFFFCAIKSVNTSTSAILGAGFAGLQIDSVAMSTLNEPSVYEHVLYRGKGKHKVC